MQKENKQTQMGLVKAYFEKNPNRDVKHPEVVDWVTKKWEKLTGEKFRDPDRAVRSLYQKGFLMKVEKGVYKYDPSVATQKTTEDFSLAQKKKILKKDCYRCVVCGASEKNGAELHVDHIRPKDKGGKADVSNGQTLCSQHNFLKKNLNQTETGKKMFIRLYELAKEEGDKDLQKFCQDVLKMYKKHKINGHIEWKEK